MYNKKQVRRFSDRISAETCLKRISLVVNPPKLSSAGSSAPRPSCLRQLRPPFRLMNRECARPYSYWDYWMKQMLGNFWAKWNLYFIFSAPSLLKKRSRVTAPKWVIFVLKSSKVISFWRLWLQPRASGSWGHRSWTSLLKFMDLRLLSWMFLIVQAGYYP